MKRQTCDHSADSSMHEHQQCCLQVHDIIAHTFPCFASHPFSFNGSRTVSCMAVCCSVCVCAGGAAARCCAAASVWCAAAVITVIGVSHVGVDHPTLSLAVSPSPSLSLSLSLPSCHERYTQPRRSSAHVHTGQAHQHRHIEHSHQSHSRSSPQKRQQLPHAVVNEDPQQHRHHVHNSTKHHIISYNRILQI